MLRLDAAAVSEARLAKVHRNAMLDHLGSQKFSAEDFMKLDPEDWKHTDGRDNYTSAEVQIGKRCHGAHLEVLAKPITPVGSHYLLVHYDVPLLDPESHAVKIHGLVESELSLTLSDAKKRPSITQAVLMACAGIGRAQQTKRFWTHAPWGPDSFGCSEWTGIPLADVLAEAGLKDGAKQIIFTGADKGVEGNVVQHFQRSLSVEEATKGHVMLAYQMNGQGSSALPLPPDPAAIASPDTLCPPPDTVSSSCLCLPIRPHPGSRSPPSPHRSWMVSPGLRHPPFPTPRHSRAHSLSNP